MSNPAPVLTVIQPDMAAAWLEQNTNNRSINTTRVKRYAADMAEGNWAVTGDSIRFSKSGKLLDGQHRLWACVESAAPFTAYVLKGLPEDSQLYMDQGMPRSKGSQLKIRGYERSGTLASAASTFWRFVHPEGRHAMTQRAMNPSNSQLLEIIEGNPDIEHCLTKYSDFRSTSGARIQPGTAVAMYVMMSRYNVTKADEFMEALLTGANLYRGHPVLALRERILQAKIKNQRVSPVMLITWFSYAWRSFVRGKSINKLSPRYRLPTFPGSPGTWEGPGLPF